MSNEIEIRGYLIVDSRNNQPVAVESSRDAAREAKRWFADWVYDSNDELTEQQALRNFKIYNIQKQQFVR